MDAELDETRQRRRTTEPSQTVLDAEPRPKATQKANTWTEAKVDTENQERGPLLIISGEKDDTPHKCWHETPAAASG